MTAGRKKIGGLSMLLAAGMFGGAAPLHAAETGAELRELRQRVERLEEQNRKLDEALSEQRISADEPPLAARLKAAESDVFSFRKAARTIESIEGIQAGAGLTMFAQSLLNSEAAPGANNSELNYRADATVRLPAGTLGNSSEGFLFAHFRMGQGRGLQSPGPAFSATNTTSFQRPGAEPSDSTALLAQAWYQLNMPLPVGGNPQLSRRHLEFNFGKMDPFAFFDQNSAADDETRAFVNQAFLHNPLLDVGGDIGVDGFGFTPGFRFAYVNDYYKPQSYGLSVGLFGAGKGASFDDSLSSPFVIVQAETGQRFFSGLAGNYRLYVWSNGRGADYDGTVTQHRGAGVSADQRVGDAVTLFGRYGQQSRGKVRFDRALTLGTEIGGSYWARGADALGVAAGWLRTSDEFRRDAPTLDADADGVPDFGYTASGAERVAEVYYRYRLNPQFEVSPDLQYLARPGGDTAARAIKVFGLRAQLTF